MSIEDNTNQRLQVCNQLLPTPPHIMLCQSSGDAQVPCQQTKGCAGQAWAPEYVQCLQQHADKTTPTSGPGPGNRSDCQHPLETSGPTGTRCPCAGAQAQSVSRVLYTKPPLVHLVCKQSDVLR
jgi:hypothetical protein